MTLEEEEVSGALMPALVLIMFLIGFLCGFLCFTSLNYYNLQNNTVSGYHCGKLTKHKTLDSAKKQVEINQDAAGVK